MNAASDAKDAHGWLKADIELHHVLFEMAGNDRARRLVLNLNDQWHRVRIGFVACRDAPDALLVNMPALWNPY